MANALLFAMKATSIHLYTGVNISIAKIETYTWKGTHQPGYKNHTLGQHVELKGCISALVVSFLASLWVEDGWLQLPQ